MNQKIIKNFLEYDRKKGFTLIEIMVSLTLFTTVMIITISSLISINNANNKTQDIRAIIDSLHFSLENISRTLRTGSGYNCGNDFTVFPSGVNDCPAGVGVGGNSIALTSSSGNSVMYKLNTSSNRVQKFVDSGSGGTFLDITSSEVKVDILGFYVDGAVIGDSKQPRVLIILKGSITSKNNLITEFNLQTTISQRFIDS